MAAFFTIQICVLDLNVHYATTHWVAMCMHIAG